MSHDGGPVRNRRRKDARPDEILEAARQEFTLNGFAATRLDDIARRARISKGTIYLYFANKEQLFNALLRQSLTPQIEHIAGLVETYPGSMEAFLGDHFKVFQRAIFDSDARHLVRLLIAEASAFPELTAFYFDEVVQPGLDVLRRIVARGVATGEFRPTALEEFPHLLVAPALLGLLWKGLFEQYRPLDMDGLIATHLDLVVRGLKP